MQQNIWKNILSLQIKINSINSNYIYRAIGLMSTVFANGPENRDSNPRSSHTKDSKNGTWCRLA